MRSLVKRVMAVRVICRVPGDNWLRIVTVFALENHEP